MIVDANYVIDPKKWILENQESIMEYYLGIKLGNNLIKSPLREDARPTCGFYYGKTGKLYLHDFGTEEHIDVFEIVKRKFRLTYAEAIQKILRDAPKFKEAQSSSKKELVYEFTAGNKEWMLNYFKKFGISEQTLDEYQVFPVKVVYINQQIAYRSTQTNPIFAYKFSSGRMKLYRPLTKGEGKWGGNATSRDIQGIDQLPWTGQILFITSSLKDVMCLKELGFNAIAFNGEGFGASKGNSDTNNLVKDTIKSLKRRFEHIIFYMDNDRAGIDYSNRLTKNYSIPHVYNPLGYPKDISDCVKLLGINKGKKIIKKMLSKYFNLNKIDYVAFANNLDSGSLAIQYQI